MTEIKKKFVLFTANIAEKLGSINWGAFCSLSPGINFSSHEYYKEYYRITHIVFFF